MRGVKLTESGIIALNVMAHLAEHSVKYFEDHPDSDYKKMWIKANEEANIIDGDDPDKENLQYMRPCLEEAKELVAAITQVAIMNGLALALGEINDVDNSNTQSPPGGAGVS